MPRDGSTTYHLPPGTAGIPDTTIESAKYNTFINDIALDLNTARPILYGGTGAINAHDAMVALGGEIAKQGPVTNFDSFPFASGTWYSNAGATAAPTANRFAGMYYANADDSYAAIEARDQTTGTLYVKKKVAGVWDATWSQQVGSAADIDARYVNTAGDVMTGYLGVNSPIHNWPFIVKAGPNINLGVVDAGSGTAQLGNLNDAGNAWLPMSIPSAVSMGSSLAVAGALTAGAITTGGAITASGAVTANPAYLNGTNYAITDGTNYIIRSNGANYMQRHDGYTRAYFADAGLNVTGTITASGALTLSGPGIAVGGAVSTGFYSDGSNVAIRTFGANGIYMQAAGGGANYAVISNGSATFNGTLSAASTITAPSLTINSGAVTLFQGGGVIGQGSGGTVMVQSAGGGNQAFITFHNAGAFAGNFGLGSDGNMYMGGWSWGAGNAYRFWTTKDFAALPAAPTAPSLGAVSNAQWVLAGTQSSQSGSVIEPYTGAAVTGFAGQAGDFNIFMLKFRYLQLYTSGWFTVGYVG